MLYLPIRPCQWSRPDTHDILELWIQLGQHLDLALPVFWMSTFLFHFLYPHFFKEKSIYCKCIRFQIRHMPLDPWLCNILILGESKAWHFIFWAKVQMQSIKGQNFIRPIAIEQFMLENCSTNLEESLLHREYIVWSMVLWAVVWLVKNAFWVSGICEWS